MKTILIIKKGTERFKAKSLMRILLATTFCTLNFALLTSCIEDPDDSNLNPYENETISTYLQSHSDQFSSFYYLLQRVKLDQLLSSYGQYTCFAPTNDAIATYIDSLYNDTGNHYLAHNGMTENSLQGLTDSLCADIAKYHLANTLITSIDMSTGREITTMLDRTVTASVDTTTAATVLNATAAITSKDNEVLNGVIHVIDHVIPRSNRVIAEEMGKHDEYSIFYQALMLTALADSLTQTEKEGSLGEASTDAGFWTIDKNRVGFTIFAETDDVLRANGIEDINSLIAYANNEYGHCAAPNTGWYDYARNHGIQVSTKNDYTNPWNALNLFMRYHILKYSIPRDYLIIDRHYTHDLGSECYEYYETMLPKTLMKIWQVQGTLYINRYITNNTLTNEVEGFGDIHELKRRGICLQSKASLSPVNGYIHPIDQMLVYDELVPHGVLNERMRFHAVSCLGEFMSNGLRWMSKAEAQALNGGKATARARIPSNFCENIRIYNNTTKLDYNFYDTGDYLAFQGDGLRGSGIYDLAIKLAPVPDGVYELRTSYGSVTDHGSMFQYYIGTSPDIADMQAVDIPLDSRLDFVEAPSIRWTFAKEEEDLGVASDQALRSRGYMRGPLSFERITGHINARWGVIGDTYHITARRIILKQKFTQGDIWIRIKSVIPENTSGVFGFSYFEFCPVNVYDNPQYSEDMY